MKNRLDGVLKELRDYAPFSILTRGRGYCVQIFRDDECVHEESGLELREVAEEAKAWCARAI